jgi:hypothetical protein
LSATSDTTHGGGHVAAVIISNKAKQGFQSTTVYQHQSVLRLIREGLVVSNLPGDSGTTPGMGNSSEFVIRKGFSPVPPALINIWCSAAHQGDVRAHGRIHAIAPSGKKWAEPDSNNG